MNTMIINFDKLTGAGRVRNLSGKERGIAGRVELGLDSLDGSAEIVEVVVPDYIDTISPSYFQGMFSASVERLRGRDKFLNKYHFKASEQAMRWIELGIRNTTSSRADLI